MTNNNTHHQGIGYILWIFGFTGSHRFYFGKSLSGAIYFLTLGLFGIGWLIDIFLIPAMARQAEFKFTAGKIDYTIAWVLITFFGLFGVHRRYMGKWITGILYLLTLGIFGFGYLWEFFR